MDLGSAISFRQQAPYQGKGLVRSSGPYLYEVNSSSSLLKDPVHP